MLAHSMMARIGGADNLPSIRIGRSSTTQNCTMFVHGVSTSQKGLIENDRFGNSNYHRRGWLAMPYVIVGIENKKYHPLYRAHTPRSYAASVH